VSVSRTTGKPPDFTLPPTAGSAPERGTGGAAPGNGPATAAGRRLGKAKTRSGLGSVFPGEEIEVWSDEDWALATGLQQILDEQGHADPARVPALTRAELVRMFRGMVLSRLLDGRLLPLQRQGRIGFYIGASGQEAGIIAGAHALGPDDFLIPGLRETSAGLYRGLPLRTHLAQVFGNSNDLGHGRQLPCHSGSRASRHVVMSSCVSSQIPHATGVAWAAKISKDPVVALCYLGDGGTSEEDFHVGLNFAGVFKLPVVFVCQNNQWAISTPLSLQTASETIAVKGLAYGVPSVRVDGNDVLGMYAAVKLAVDRARGGGGPAFIEALTYRIGPHSSSDDPTRYRDEAEPTAWKQKDPLVRFGHWLATSGNLPEADQGTLHEEVDREIREAIMLEEKAPSPALATLIQDVTAEPNWILEEQLADLERIRAKR
jgi:pyruvate dehydrogenase E1 component alpha subunit/2-oxoisovalerate dehydrogenase E1 component alpha subunit